MTSMTENSKTLNSFKHIINATWWTRLFSWKELSNILTELRSIFSQLIENNEAALKKNSFLQQSYEELIAEQAATNERLSEAQKQSAITAEKIKLLEPLEHKNNSMQAELNELKQKQKSREQEYLNRIKTLDTMQAGIEKSEEKKEQEAIEKIQAERERLKKTWKHHEEHVKKTIVQLCNQHAIEYVKEIPFEGKAPDNVIKILNDYVIFDAKSPANEDLSNFPTYIKNQVKTVGKYAKNDSVHRQLYLVIPSNTAECIEQKTYTDSSYTAHVITLDSMETILLSLKKLEEYDFAGKLSPEDREGICRFIAGVMSYSKRKLQVDSFFNEWLLAFIRNNEGLVPAEIMDRVKQMELGTKINPPNQKTNKQIDIGIEELRTANIQSIATNMFKLNEEKNYKKADE